ncbi:hypothetical protein [Paenibacillus sp. PAMC21692]|uniref:hypothetical protein n=1 Tax=Paenibacillus sp. PAMC21692 TaxID=2762320 RepID=UPI00164DD5C6|nr:hypothetical protein [Paenibacillus sp. PAMC21692]QNK54584.1 hypothetical protein H7F31_18155 [Paenibacillus sp. PAMC21692]
MYYEEIDRFKQVEAKTNIALAFAGIFFGGFITFAVSNTPVNKDIGYLTYSLIFKAVVVVFFLVAAFFFYRSLKSNGYAQLTLENIVNEETALEPANDTHLSIAATYKDAVIANRQRIEEKTDDYDNGLKYISWSFLIFVLHYIVEVVIKYVST